MSSIMKTDMVVAGIIIVAVVSVILMFVIMLLMDVLKKKKERGYKIMTNEEREVLKAKMAARQQSNSSNTGNMNNNQKTCSGCGSVIPANYDVCPVCGAVLRQGVKMKAQGQVQSRSNEMGKNFAIASLSLGIVGAILTWFTLGILGLACGIVGIILAKKAKQKGYESGLRTAGFVLSIISAALGGIMLIFNLISVLGTVILFNSLDNWVDSYDSVPDGTKTINDLGGGAAILIQSLFKK